ncbi:hypothetical protein V1282_003504 [Nitrobacteraceae bacterium AZCC 2146]
MLDAIAKALEAQMVELFEAKARPSKKADTGKNSPRKSRTKD